MLKFLSTRRSQNFENRKTSEYENIIILLNRKMPESEFARPGNTGEGMNINVL